jgi:transposase-like protein
MTKIGGLSAKKRVAAAMLAGGATGRDTASKIGVSEDTVSRWRRSPAFQSTVIHLIRETESSAVESLHALRLLAVDRLGELLKSKNELVALRAATEVLDRTVHSIPGADYVPESEEHVARFMHALALDLMNQKEDLVK